MVTKRTRRWLLAGAAAALVAVAGMVCAELVLRGQADSRLESTAGDIPGVDVSLSGGPVLWQIAAGAVQADVTVDQAAVDKLIACRRRDDLTVRLVTGGVAVSAERMVRGLTVPVDVLLVPTQREDRTWLLVADSVSVGGITIPAERAVKLLARSDGSAGLAERLSAGIRVPAGAWAVSALTFSEGSATATVSVPTTRTSEDADRSGLSTLRECLDDTEEDQ